MTDGYFESEKDLWKARCLRFAEALVDVMDGVKDHHIGAETGLPEEDCERIAKARAVGVQVEGTVIRGD